MGVLGRNRLKENMRNVQNCSYKYVIASTTTTKQCCKSGKTLSSFNTSTTLFEVA